MERSECRTCSATVILPVYNDEEDVSAAVESVLAQSHRDFEFLISDNHSSDGTARILRDFRDPRMKVFEQVENIGYLGNTNFLLERAVGNIVFTIHADDRFLPNYLEEAMALFAADHTLGVVHFAGGGTRRTLTPRRYAAYLAALRPIPAPTDTAVRRIGGASMRFGEDYWTSEAEMYSRYAELCYRGMIHEGLYSMRYYGPLKDSSSPEKLALRTLQISEFYTRHRGIPLTARDRLHRDLVLAKANLASLLRSRAALIGRGGGRTWAAIRSVANLGLLAANAISAVFAGATPFGLLPSATRGRGRQA